jgi:hypothetical protein
MAAITTAIIAAAGIAASVYGTAKQLQGQAGQTKALKKAEKAREKQNNLDVQRRRREIIRNQIVAQSQAKFAAFQQGAGFGSGLQGGYAQISGQTGGQQVALGQNYSLGQDIFAANQAYYDASGTTSFGAGLTSLGGAIINNSQTLGRVANYAVGRARNA